MQAIYEIYQHPLRGYLAVKRGFSWPGFLLSAVWLLRLQLWIPGVILLGVGGGVGYSILHLSQARLFFAIIAWLALGLFSGVKANGWLSKALQNRDYSYLGAFRAHSGSDAIAKIGRTGGVVLDEWKLSDSRSELIRVPTGLRQVFAVAQNTWKASFRFKLIPVLAVALVGSVVALPQIIIDDGTAAGLIQILITYNLGIITTILGLATLWLSCGSLSRDIDECQMQMVVVKPIARWQIWLGKWIGIMGLNALLLGLSGITLYFLIEWRAGRLSNKQQEILRSQLLVARASRLPEEAKTAGKFIDDTVETELKLRLKDTSVTGADLDTVRKDIREQVKAAIQVVPSGYQRLWTIDLSDLPQSRRDQITFLRVKFSVSRYSPNPIPYPTVWEVGPRDSPQRQVTPVMMLTTDTFTEIPVPPGLLDKDGKMIVAFQNVTDVNVLFSTEDGLELLYHESSFGVNFFRGVMILYFWLGLLAVLGLTSASFLSFPVAAFLSLTTLLVGLASGTIGQVLKEGSFVGGYSGAVNPTIWDHIFLPMLRGMLWTVDLALNYSPIDSLSAGRSITWFLLGKAFVMIVLATSGALAAVGIVCFTRRELAAVQSS